MARLPWCATRRDRGALHLQFVWVKSWLWYALNTFTKLANATSSSLMVPGSARADGFFPLCALAAAAWLMQAQVAGCPCPQRRLPVRWAGESWWWLYVLMNCLLPSSSSSGNSTMPFLCVGRCRSCRRSLSHWAPWLKWPTRLHDCTSACEFSSPSIWQPRFESPRCNDSGQNRCLGRYPWARGFICPHHISRCQQPRFPGGMAGPWGHWYCLIWAALFCNSQDPPMTRERQQKTRCQKSTCCQNGPLAWVLARWRWGVHPEAPHEKIFNFGSFPQTWTRQWKHCKWLQETIKHASFSWRTNSKYITGAGFTNRHFHSQGVAFLKRKEDSFSISSIPLQKATLFLKTYVFISQHVNMHSLIQNMSADPFHNVLGTELLEDWKEETSCTKSPCNIQRIFQSNKVK